MNNPNASMWLEPKKLTPSQREAVEKSIKWKLTDSQVADIITMLEQLLTLQPRFAAPENDRAEQRNALIKLQKHIKGTTDAIHDLDTLGRLSLLENPYKYFLRQHLGGENVGQATSIAALVASMTSFSDAIAMRLPDLKPDRGKPIDTDYLYETKVIIAFFRKHFGDDTISTAENGRFAHFLSAVYTHLFGLKNFDIRSRIETALKHPPER
jgi:energy-converting hydrogenase Eha subunit A